MKNFAAVVLVMLLGCTPSEKQKKLDEFNLYLSEVFPSEQNSLESMYFLFHPFCFECSQGVVDMLRDIQCEKMKIICVGQVSDENFKKLEGISNGRHVLFDKSFKGKRYDLGIEKGIFVHAVNGKVREYQALIDYDPNLVSYVNNACITE
jgi:hypothetical protein